MQENAIQSSTVNEDAPFPAAPQSVLQSHHAVAGASKATASLPTYFPASLPAYLSAVRPVSVGCKCRVLPVGCVHVAGDERDANSRHRVHAKHAQHL